MLTMFERSEMRSTYARAKARWCRWEEEIELLLEEMRRVVATFFWIERKWLARTTARVEAREDIHSGLVSYALRQASVYRGLAYRFGLKWVPQVAGLGLQVNWEPRLVDHVQSVIAARSVTKSSIQGLNAPSSLSTSFPATESPIPTTTISPSGTTSVSVLEPPTTSFASSSSSTTTSTSYSQSRANGTSAVPGTSGSQRWTQDARNAVSAELSLLDAVEALRLDASDESDGIASDLSAEDGVFSNDGIPYGGFDSD